MFVGECINPKSTLLTIIPTTGRSLNKQPTIPPLNTISSKLNKIENLTTTVVPVKSEYWGKDITVAGLITTDDLIRTIKSQAADLVVIPSVMLRPYSEDFLDGKNLDYVKKQTNKEFLVIQNNYSMKELVDYLTKIS